MTEDQLIELLMLRRGMAQWNANQLRARSRSVDAGGRRLRPGKRSSN
jgi:hypothetical protein